MKQDERNSTADSKVPAPIISSKSAAAVSLQLTHSTWERGEGGGRREREEKKERKRKKRASENPNLKTLFYKDCSLGSVKTCQLVTERERDRQAERRRGQRQRDRDRETETEKRKEEEKW